MRVQEIATGLWRWTGLHPAWTPADGGPGGWEQEVGCYFYEGAGRDRALRPAGADGGPRPVLRGARPRRRADRLARADPADGGGSSTLCGRAGGAVRRNRRRDAGRGGACARPLGRAGLLDSRSTGPRPRRRRHRPWRRAARSRAPGSARSTTRRSSRGCVRCWSCRSNACSSRTASPCSRTAALPWRPRCAPDEPPADEHLTYPA